MPAKSVAQRKLFAIAEHSPQELYPQDAKLAKLSHDVLHDFAAVSEKGLPKRISPPKVPSVPKVRKPGFYD